MLLTLNAVPKDEKSIFSTLNEKDMDYINKIHKTKHVILMILENCRKVIGQAAVLQSGAHCRYAVGSYSVLFQWDGALNTSRFFNSLITAVTNLYPIISALKHFTQIHLGSLCGSPGSQKYLPGNQPANSPSPNQKVSIITSGIPIRVWSSYLPYQVSTSCAEVH